MSLSSQRDRRVVSLPSPPICPVCCELLGRYGGPCGLPCGHSGCVDCLSAVVEASTGRGSSGQQHRPPLCPICRAPFPSALPLRPNCELRDLLNFCQATMLEDEERDAGWEDFPDRKLTAEEYAADLKQGHAMTLPSAPPAPQPRGEAVALAHGQVMDLDPPHWLPDSLATACGACHRPFKALTRLRHHCRCCGRVYCSACSDQRCLLPPRFNTRHPERTCDTCAAMLSPLQLYLASTQAVAAQPPVHDATDSVALRAWINPPYCATLEQDIYKADNILRKFTKTYRLSSEQGLPAAVLSGASGLIIMTSMKVGMGWSATFGTGLVVSRNSAGGWSAPCAVSVAGLGWGFQLGGGLTDLVLVLRSEEMVRAVCDATHYQAAVGVGGSMGAALGPLGRTADASLMIGSGALRASPTPAYAYSCSQGAYVGISLESSLLQVRHSINHAFYGVPLSATALLVQRSVEPPPAAAALYDALRDLFDKYEVRSSIAPITCHAAATEKLAAPESALPTPTPLASQTDTSTVSSSAPVYQSSWDTEAPAPLQEPQAPLHMQLGMTRTAAQSVEGEDVGASGVSAWGAAASGMAEAFTGLVVRAASAAGALASAASAAGAGSVGPIVSGSHDLHIAPTVLSGAGSRLGAAAVFMQPPGVRAGAGMQQGGRMRGAAPSLQTAPTAPSTLVVRSQSGAGLSVSRSGQQPYDRRAVQESEESEDEEAYISGLFE